MYTEQIKLSGIHWDAKSVILGSKDLCLLDLQESEINYKGHAQK